MNSTDYWWNVDYISEFEEKFNRFNQIVKGIKDGTLQRTNEVVSELSQVFNECAFAVRSQYLKYCFYYETILILYCGVTPQSWWMMKDVNLMSGRAGVIYIPPGLINTGMSTTYRVGGRTVNFDFYPEWQDTPYEWEISWTAWLWPGNWGSDKWDILRERQDNKWKRFLQRIAADGWIIGEQDPRLGFFFKKMSSSRLDKIYK